MDESIDLPRIPGYVSVKEAAKLLGLSARTIYDYVDEGRLPGVRVADVIAIPEDALKNFKREPSGRPRKITPLWRISSGDNEQFMTIILVQERVDQHEALIQRLEVIRQSREHLFPGTVIRYLAESGEPAGQVVLILVWRGTVMPDETTREKALKGFRKALEDVLDWNTAQYKNGQVLMHT
jgi:excisionase family DNA binding protein